MALSGGLINWLGQTKNVQNGRFSVFELFGELFTSGFVGVGLFMFIDSMNQPMGFSAAAAGIGGHMATRFLFLIEHRIEDKLIDKNDMEQLLYHLDEADAKLSKFNMENGDEILNEDQHNHYKAILNKLAIGQKNDSCSGG
jgi:hypothetical protein